MSNVLRTVSDKFNLFKSGRINGQNFMPAIESIRRTLASPLVKQGFELGEHYGYYGHEVRAKTGKLRPSDVEFIDGTKVDVVPDCRTTSLTVSDDGTVEYTQDIFDTVGGRAMSAMIDVAAGGWSWASGSEDNHRRMTDFAGFDFVKYPNYISTKKALMLASADNDDQSIKARMIEGGLSDDEAQEKIDTFNGGDTVSRIDHNEVVEELEVLQLATDANESVLAEKDSAIADKAQELVDCQGELAQAKQTDSDNQTAAQSLMLACVNALPIFISDEVKQEAILSAGEPNKAMQMILESVANISGSEKMMLASVADSVTQAQDNARHHDSELFASYAAPTKNKFRQQ